MLPLFQQRKPCWEYNTELRWLNLNLVWLCFILSSSNFLSKIYTRTQISLNFCQHNNIYTTKKGFFSVIVINRLYCTSLTLPRFLLGFLKAFYLQIAQNTHEWMYLRWCLNLTCFMDLLLKSYKYDKIKVRIVVINYQTVSQIFKIQWHCGTAMALRHEPSQLCDISKRYKRLWTYKRNYLLYDL